MLADLLEVVADLPQLCATCASKPAAAAAAAE
jgi:hypothetical protein